MRHHLVSSVDRQRPAVAITNPLASSVKSGTFTPTVTATDNRDVLGLQWKLDGSTYGIEKTVSPFSGDALDTHTLTNGSHSFDATARDAVGNTKTDTSGFTVSNPTPGSGYLSFGSYQQFDGSDYTDGRWFVKDKNHRDNVTWRWANDPSRAGIALPANPDSTHYQMRIASVYVGYAEADPGLGHVIGVWIDKSDTGFNGGGTAEDFDTSAFLSGGTYTVNVNVSGGNNIKLAKWVPGGDDAYTAFFQDIRVYYDFVIKSPYLS